MIPADTVPLSTLLGDIEGALPTLMASYGIWIYLILFLVIFCETGLVFAPFLPGDSLLFLLGFLAAGGGLNPLGIIGFLAAAAILGDSVNYRIGSYFGKRLLEQRKCFVSPLYIETTREYYRRYGKNTIILGRFVPGIRSFAPFFAGIVKMEYPVFLTYNVAGGVLWVSCFVIFGYLIASLPVFQERQEFFLWAILLISIAMFLFMVYNIIKTFRECQMYRGEASDQILD